MTLTLSSYTVLPYSFHMGEFKVSQLEEIPTLDIDPPSPGFVQRLQPYTANDMQAILVAVPWHFGCDLS